MFCRAAYGLKSGRFVKVLNIGLGGQIELIERRQAENLFDGPGMFTIVWKLLPTTPCRV